MRLANDSKPVKEGNWTNVYPVLFVVMVFVGGWILLSQEVNDGFHTQVEEYVLLDDAVLCVFGVYFWSDLEGLGMTYKQAIEVIESHFPTANYSMLCEALNLAIEVLKEKAKDETK